MHEVSWWLHAEEPLRLAPEDVWRGADVLREDSGRHHIAQLRRMTLPPEALLLRRVEGLLFQTAAITRASALWGKLLRELIEGAETVGDLGAQHAAWLARRPNCPPGRPPGDPKGVCHRPSCTSGGGGVLPADARSVGSRSCCQLRLLSALPRTPGLNTSCSAGAVSVSARNMLLSA